MISYSIRAKNPQAHVYEVRCEVSHPDPAGQAFFLPAWIPGSYMIRDFAKNIVRFDAVCGTESVTVSKRDKQTWRCAACVGPLVIRYDVYAWDLSVRAAHLDATHGYYNGTSVFMMVVGQENDACAVDILSPIGAQYAQWRVATALTRDGAAPLGFGRYKASDYAELVDHPVEMGQFSHGSFDACGVRHEIAITGRHSADMSRLERDLKNICEAQIRFFGEPAPMDRYVFLVMAVGEGYGGLEHRASTSLLCSRDDLPSPSMTDITDDYRTFLGLCSHEYFHTWHVKRIKPAVFIPYDLSREVHTALLWIFEGITSYYDELFLVRAGIITHSTYLEMQGQSLTRVYRTPGRLKQSASESSFDAWTKFYKQDENSPNAIVSYYAKGALVALALDLLLRRETVGRCSLDDVMKYLWREFGQRGIGIGEDQFGAIVKHVTGCDVDAFLRIAVDGTEDLPLAELFASVGVDFSLRPALSQDDKGGKPAPSSAAKARGVFGVKVATAEGGARIVHAFDGGAAQSAGLSAGDIIVAVAGLKVTGNSFDRVLAAREIGVPVKVHAFRRDELFEYDVVPMQAAANTCVLQAQSKMLADVQQRFDAWLGVATPTITC